MRESCSTISSVVRRIARASSSDTRQSMRGTLMPKRSRRSDSVTRLLAFGSCSHIDSRKSSSSFRVRLLYKIRRSLRPPEDQVIVHQYREEILADISFSAQDVPQRIHGSSGALCLPTQ